MLGLTLFKTVLEQGWCLDNDRFGAPNGRTCAFPLPDALHFGVVKLLGGCSRIWRCGQLVYLSAFPLTALTSYFALRRFKLGRLAAVVASVLYALPYHFWTWSAIPCWRPITYCR